MQSFNNQFLNWAKSKNPNKKYDYRHSMGCALYQFLEESGYPVEAVGGCGVWYDTKGKRHATDLHEVLTPQGKNFNEEYKTNVVWTYGQLTERLEAFLDV